MSVIVRLRREAASFLATYFGSAGEILINTTTWRVHVQDGATNNGYPHALLTDLIPVIYTLATLPASPTQYQVVAASDLGGVAGRLIASGVPSIPGWIRETEHGSAINTTLVTGAASLVYLTAPSTQFYNVTLTGNVTLTMSATDASGHTVGKGARQRIILSSTATMAAHTFAIVNGGGGGGTLKTLSAAGTGIEIEFDGTNWVEIASITL